MATEVKTETKTVKTETQDHFISDFVDWAYDMVYAAFKFLPDSPIQDFNLDKDFNFAGVGNVMATVNYVVPFGDLLFLTAAYISACGAYIGVRYVLRMTRFIQ